MTKEEAYRNLIAHEVRDDQVVRDLELFRSSPLATRQANPMKWMLPILEEEAKRRGGLDHCKTCPACEGRGWVSEF